jgi:peptidoglycan biosynthesis protein MviN/MurJ (putative lipid II flippase)
MTHPVLNRILMLDHVADERYQQHQRLSTSAAAIVGTLTVFVLLEYRLLIEHRVPWDLIAVIYAMGATKIALVIWYRFRN